MSDFKNVMKGGWHPKGKEGGKESWRGDFKGINQVAGWMGKGKKPGEAERSEHVSRPLTTLKDPSSFGPPPKNVNYHGGAALPNEITPHTHGLGAPLSQAQIESANRAVHGPPVDAVEEQEKRTVPPLPYRADRTGLQTSHLPPPPVHRDVASATSPEVAQTPRPQPGLPPRLPSRQASVGVPSPASPSPPSYDTAVHAQSQAASTNDGLNNSAINRLGNAGISVPGFGIGKKNETNTTNPWKNERSQSTTSPPPSTTTPDAFSALQSRFSRMNSSTSPSTTTTPPLVTAPTSPQPQPQPTPQPPTLQQSQSLLRTANQFHQNPSSVSATDAHAAANTAHSAARSGAAFRDKHADTFAAAGQRANAFNQKYKVQSRFEKFLDKHAPLEPQGQEQGQGQQGGFQSPPPPQIQQPLPQQPQMSTAPVAAPAVQGNASATASPELAASISRKPPPPPPPKKPTGLHGNVQPGGGVGVGAGVGVAAPPVPLGTKPGYS